MFWIYNILLALFSPIWVPYLYFHSKKRKPAPLWKERMGNYGLSPNKNERRIWIHAVSVGEVLAAKSILEEIRTLMPDHKIVLSATTSSGYDTAQGENKKKLDASKPGLYDYLVYFPIDLPRFTLAAIQQIQPEAIGLMESELWWNFLWAAKVFDSQVLILNGRVSDRSYPRIQKLKPFYRGMLGLVDRCLMQSDLDASRIQSVGARKVEVLGNCKFDEPVVQQKHSKSDWRHKFGLRKDLQTLVIGSTRGEAEELFIGEFLQLLPSDIQSRLQIVHAPRHIERASKVMEIAALNGWSPRSRSSDESSQYLVLDTYGELSSVYGAADLAIVGGGFDNLGGQNLIQPLAHGVPVLHGPNMQNFRGVASLAHKAGCALVCKTPAELSQEVCKLLDDQELLTKMGRAALELVAANQGASKRYAQALSDAASTSFLAGEARRKKIAARKAKLDQHPTPISEEAGNTQH